MGTAEGAKDVLRPVTPLWDPIMQVWLALSYSGPVTMILVDRFAAVVADKDRQNKTEYNSLSAQHKESEPESFFFFEILF